MHVGDVVAAIRAEVPSMEIGVTTGRWIEPDPRLRIEAVLAWGHLGMGKPDVCSVNVHEKGWIDVCAAAHVGRHRRRARCLDHAATPSRCAPTGCRPAPRGCSPSPPCRIPRRPSPRRVRILRALGPSQVPILLHGEEDGAWPVLEYAMRHNLDTRIGFEDVLVRPDGWLATGNDDLVREALRIKKELAPSGADQYYPALVGYATEFTVVTVAEDVASVGNAQYR